MPLQGRTYTHMWGYHVLLFSQPTVEASVAVAVLQVAVSLPMRGHVAHDPLGVGLAVEGVGLLKRDIRIASLAVHSVHRAPCMGWGRLGQSHPRYAA